MRNRGLLLAITLTSCGHKLDGPSPEATGLVALVDLDGDESTQLTESPAVVCNDQVEARLKLTGTGFAPLVEKALVDPRAVMPRITLIDEAGGRHRVPDDSEAPDASRVDWVSKQEIQFDLVPTDYDPLLPTGLYDIEIANYQNEGNEEDPGGRIFVLEDALAVVPPPVLEASTPDLTCDAQAMQTITLTGTTFLQITIGDTVLLPSVAVTSADDSAVYDADAVDPMSCAPVGGNVTDVLVCTSLSFTIPMADLDPTAAGETPADYEMVVTNPLPANCASADSAATLTVAPPPSVATVVPDLICTDEEDKVITVTGTGFLDVDGLLPTVNVGTNAYTASAVNAATCTDVPGPAASPGSTTAVRTCTELTFTVPMDVLTLGNYDVTVTNPPPAGCTSSVPVTLTIVPPPTVESIAPDLTCSADGARTLTLTGTGFLSVNGTTLPTVTVGTDPVIASSSVSGCMDLPGSPVLSETVQTCTTLTFDLPTTATPGLQPVTVTNPPEADCTSAPINLLVAGDPVITAIVPPSECQGAVPAQITVSGTGFLTVDGALPTYTFDGIGQGAVASAMNCTAVPGVTENVQSCTDLVIDVPSPGTLALGAHPVTVTNPAPVDCTAAAFNFFVATPPTVTGIVPNRVCEDLPMTYTVIGSAFTLGTVVEIDDGVTPILGTVTAVSMAQDQMTVDFGALNPGSYTIIVSNDGIPDGIGCDDTLAAALTVEPTPFVFFADPPVVYNGISTQITVYATNINCDPDPPITLPGDCIGFVGIGPAGGGSATIDLTASAVYDLSRPNRVQVVVPAEALGGPTPGSYDVFFADALGCIAAPLANGLNVTNNVAINLLAVDPPFGQTGINTAVTVKAETPPMGAFTADFDPTPRAYLNPTLGGTAAAVRAVAFVDDGTITGIAPAAPALAPGQYDVIVVNPDGTVGVSSASTGPFFFNVTAAPPPVIANLTPGSTPSDAGQAITIEGTGFDNPCPGTCPAVVFECRAPGAMVTTFPPRTVDASTATTIDVTLDASGLTDGTTCVVRVTNADGSFGDFSALSITNPSQNINNFANTGQPLVVGRRALSAVAGRATRAARFIYAIGGDDGTSVGAMDGIEAASVDGFGVLSPWGTLPNTLPVPRTLAGAAVLDHQGRRFIYLVGGNDGTTVVDTVLRAEVLNPTRSPEIVNLDFTPDSAVGFVAPGVTPGGWNYKVAAVFDVADTENPSGESLPSDVQPLTVPATPAVDVTIEWSAVPNAVGYRIYRSPTPGLGTGTEELIATVGVTTFYTDTGNDAPDPAQVPLDIGDLGNWATVATLNTPREGLGVAIAADPDTADGFFLYALAGRDDTSAVLDTYEVAAITVNPLDGTQAVGAFVEDGANVLATARWQIGAYSMDRAVAPSIPVGETYVYALGGLNGADNSVTDAQGALVGADGTLGAWVTVDNMNPARGGFGAVGANNFLLAIAGGDVLDDPTPITSSRSVLICAAGGGTCEGPPPNLENWNNDPATMICNRYLMGIARESATIFLIGGANDGTCLNGSPTTSTESTAW